MLDFITEQDWYKAHSSDIKSVGLPRLVFTKKDSKHWNFEATRRCRTFNNENGPQVQSNLKNLLASTPKHSTLDGQGQNVMLQHLR